MPERMGVSVLVKNSDHKVLLGRRKGSYRPGEHGFPGGKVDPGEQADVAARRELIEETGIFPQELTYIGVVKEPSVDGATYTRFGYFCNNYLGDPVNTEPDQCEGWEWFSPEELPEDTIPGTRAIVDMYLNPDSERVRDLRD